MQLYNANLPDILPNFKKRKWIFYAIYIAYLMIE